MSSSSRPYVIKDISSKAPLHYESEIQRRVEPLQPELKKALNSLEENTSDFIRYNSIGRLGVTLVILDPAVKRIVGTDKKGFITQEAVQHFEDLRRSVHHNVHCTSQLDQQNHSQLTFESGHCTCNLVLVS